MRIDARGSAVIVSFFWRRPCERRGFLPRLVNFIEYVVATAVVICQRSGFFPPLVKGGLGGVGTQAPETSLLFFGGAEQ
jgi:hypothetical protein